MNLTEEQKQLLIDQRDYFICSLKGLMDDDKIDEMIHVTTYTLARAGVVEMPSCTYDVTKDKTTFSITRAAAYIEADTLSAHCKFKVGEHPEFTPLPCDQHGLTSSLSEYKTQDLIVSKISVTSQLTDNHGIPLRGVYSVGVTYENDIEVGYVLRDVNSIEYIDYSKYKVIDMTKSDDEAR